MDESLKKGQSTSALEAGVRRIEQILGMADPLPRFIGLDEAVEVF